MAYTLSREARRTMYVYGSAQHTKIENIKIYLCNKSRETVCCCVFSRISNIY